MTTSSHSSFRTHALTARIPVVLLAAAALALAGCGGAPQHGFGGGGPVPVKAAKVTSETVPLQVHAIGNVVPSSTVDVNSRVGGQLENVHFTKGQRVAKGQLLFTLDRRPFEAAVREAEAQLARDRAQLEKARADVKRYGRLVKDEYVTKEQYDQAVATADALEAAVNGDQAALEGAKLQLEYATIRSPIAGRTGDLLVHAGNQVKANDKTMVVINQVRPIDVSFAVPERYLGSIRQRLAAGNHLAVRAAGAADNDTAKGELTFVDNTVDEATGTIRLMATFANRDDRLWPGEFVDAWLILGEQSDAVVVPTTAVQTGQAGTFVYVVKDDGTVEQRPVEVDRELDGKTVIASGLEPGLEVVTDGQLRLVPGAKVEVKKDGETPAAGAGEAQAS